MNDQERIPDGTKQYNRYAAPAMVSGANLKTGKETLIFQWITIFPVSHSSKMSPVRLPNFEGDKWETYVLQHVLHLVGDNLYGHLLHLGTVLDVAECRIIVGVAGTRHDVIGRCL